MPLALKVSLCAVLGLCTAMHCPGSGNQLSTTQHNPAI